MSEKAKPVAINPVIYQAGVEPEEQSEPDRWMQSKRPKASKTSLQSKPMEKRTSAREGSAESPCDG